MNLLFLFFQTLFLFLGGYHLLFIFFVFFFYERKDVHYSHSSEINHAIRKLHQHLIAVCSYLETRKSAAHSSTDTSDGSIFEFEENDEMDFGDSMKHMTGSSRRVINPFESIIKNTFEIVKRAEKNKARCKLANLARMNGVGEYINEVANTDPNTRTSITFYEGGQQKHLDFPEYYVNTAMQLEIKGIICYYIARRLDEKELKEIEIKNEIKETKKQKNKNEINTSKNKELKNNTKQKRNKSTKI